MGAPNGICSQEWAKTVLPAVAAYPTVPGPPGQPNVDWPTPRAVWMCMVTPPSPLSVRKLPIATFPATEEPGPRRSRYNPRIRTRRSFS